jgi:hypothetical protein
LAALKVVDVNTCETELEKMMKSGLTFKQAEEALHLKNVSQPEINRVNDPNLVTWERVCFTLFSMLVSSSFFAAYNVTTFYLGVVLVSGFTIRTILIFNFWEAHQYETTMPDVIIKLAEAVYLKRQELDLIGEEECYQIMVEIIRSPELRKAICGSSLRGSMDPLLDQMTRDDIKKLRILDDL